MKSMIAVVLLIAGLQGLPPLVGPLIPDSTGIVTGIVRRAGTGQPLADATVVVVTSIESIDQAMTRATLTDSNGRFSVKGVVPGLYIVVVQCEGYFSLSNQIPAPVRATRDVGVNEGQQTDSGIFELTPGATITGRVVGPDGKPLTASPVQALRASYIRNRLAFTPVKIGATDDLGEYRLYWLPPGQYYIRAQYRSNSAEERYDHVYFPGISEEDAAPHLTVNAGAELGGIDLRVPVKPVTGFRVSGQILRSTQDQSGTRVDSVYVVPRDRRVVLASDDSDLFQNVAADNSSGRFEIRNVPPGEYNLYPVVRESDGDLRTVAVPVDVVNKDTNQLTAPLAQAVDIRGRVTLDGNKPRDRFAKDSILLTALEVQPVTGVQSAFPINPDPETGEFVASHLPPGRYVLQLASDFRPYDVYVEDVKNGETSVLDAGFTIGSDSKDPLEVTLKSQGGAISGVVLDPSRLRPALYATVVLVPEGARRQNLAFQQQTVTGSGGSFTFRGLTPGDYKVFSWASVTSGAWGNPAFLEKFEDRGVVVHVAAGIERNVQVVVIP